MKKLTFLILIPMVMLFISGYGAISEIPAAEPIFVFEEFSDATALKSASGGTSAFVAMSMDARSAVEIKTDTGAAGWSQIMAFHSSSGKELPIFGGKGFYLSIKTASATPVSYRFDIVDVGDTTGSLYFSAPITFTSGWTEVYIPFENFKYSKDTTQTMNIDNIIGYLKINATSNFFGLKDQNGQTPIASKGKFTIYIDKMGYYGTDGKGLGTSEEPLSNEKPVGPVVEEYNLFMEFEDQFNASWRPSWIAQNGPSTHILSGRYPENLVIDNGILSILYKKEKRNNQEWTSGSMQTKKKFLYGYYECRYKYAGAKGTNNSFWLMTDPAYTEGGKTWELDINEGGYPNLVNTNFHYMKSGVPKTKGGTHMYEAKTYYAKDMDLSKEFHVYGMLLTKDTIRYYFDGEIIREIPNTFVQVPAPIRLSGAVVDWKKDVTDAIDGTKMQVDYVRYWSLGTAKAGASSGSSSLASTVSGKNTQSSDRQKEDSSVKLSSKSNGTIGKSSDTGSGIGNIPYANIVLPITIMLMATGAVVYGIYVYKKKRAGVTDTKNE